MKKMIMCFIGAMMILSLAACTPTTEKGKTGETKQTEAANSVDKVKNPDPTAPELDIVSIYTVNEDGSGLIGTMDAVEEKDAQTLAELLIEYGVLDQGTEVIEFSSEGELEEGDVGPGIVNIPGLPVEKNTREYGVLNLNQFPDEKDDMLLQAVANTYIENMDLIYMTIQVNGETVAENLTYMDAGKSVSETTAAQ